LDLSLLFATATGLLAGIVHTLAGPDHLAAVAPLAASVPKRRWLPGLFWGAGHGVGVWTVGVVALALRGVLPVTALSSWSERLVGAVLVGVGLWGLRRALRSHLPGHSHSEKPGRSAVWIGALHGLAGSSHILGILPALALPSIAASIGYVLGFGVGSAGAMASFSGALGWLAGRIARRGLSAYRFALGTLSVLAVAVGGFWLVR
jgi:hypothetical protein